MAQITQEKEAKWNIDIGASVGDTLAAIWNYTDDFVLCIEPVKKFLELLTDNVQRFGINDKVCLEQAFITDNMNQIFQTEISEKGTTVKKITQDVCHAVSGKTLDCLIKENGLALSEIFRIMK